jgi:hypothetical protein
MRNFDLKHTPGDLSAASMHIRRYGKMMLWLGYVLPLSMYALFVLLAPSDVADQFPLARRYADGIHDMLLSFSSKIDIYKHARTTQYPQVGMLASGFAISIVAYIVIASIIQTICGFEHLSKSIRGVYKSPKDRWGALLILPLFGLFCMWAFFCVGGDPSFAKNYTTQGRSGYLFISTVAILFSGIGIGLWPIQIFILVNDIFSKEKS